MVLFLFRALSSFGQLGPCTIETVAGGSRNAPGDGGLALEAELLFPTEARIGPDGAVYIIDSGHNRIRRATADGRVETFAGSGEPDYSGDGVPALEAGLSAPRSLAFGPDGSLYFFDRKLNGAGRTVTVVRRVDSAGVISTVSGGVADVFSGEGEPALDAGLGHSFLGSSAAIAVEPDGSILVSGGNRIRRITADGQINTIAGIRDPNTPGSGPVTGDGGEAIEAGLNRPRDIVVAPDGTVYFLDQASDVVRRILPDGTIDNYLSPFGAGADGTPRSEFRFSGRQLEIDSQGRLYWLDFSTVRRVGSDGRVETVWKAESETEPSDFSVSPDGRVFATVRNQVLELSDGSAETPLAGMDAEAAAGDGGLATDAVLLPQELAVGPNRQLYIGSSSLNLNRIRMVRDGVIERFAGTGRRGEVEEGLALDTSFRFLVDIAAGPDGSVFAAGFNRVYRIDPQGEISTYAGDGSLACATENRGTGSDCGDGGPALEAQTPDISQIAVDSNGVLYILTRDRDRSRNVTRWVRQVSPDGIITLLPLGESNTAASIGLDGDDLLVVLSNGDRSVIRFGPRGPVETPPRLFFTTIAGDGAGNLYVPNELGILRISESGAVNTIAPYEPGEALFSGDGGMAGEARISLTIRDLTIDSRSDLYFLDGRRVRRINQPAVCPGALLPLATGVTNAGFGFSLSPGELISIFGERLGPSDGVGAQIGPDGHLTNELAGVRVFIDGIAAPLTFVSERQINAIVPYATAVTGQLRGFEPNLRFVNDRRGRFEIEVGGVRSERLLLVNVGLAGPALFSRGDSFAAALNQDGVLNDLLNPVAPGSVFVVFGTGAGQTDPAGVDGLITGDVLPRPLADVEVMVGGELAELLYFGAAPGLVSGVFQANVRISPNQQKVGKVSVGVRVGQFDNAQTSHLTQIAVGR